SDLPPESDGGARAHVEDRYRQFKTMIGGRPGGPATPAVLPPPSVIEHDREGGHEIDLAAGGPRQGRVYGLTRVPAARAQSGRRPCSGGCARGRTRRGATASRPRCATACSPSPCPPTDRAAAPSPSRSDERPPGAGPA